MNRRAADLVETVAVKPLGCPDCGRQMDPDGDDLVCPEGHRFVCVDGYFDLWPTDASQPDIDWFATPYGTVYDRASKERGLSRLGGRLGRGGEMRDLVARMAEGVKCNPAA